VINVAGSNVGIVEGEVNNTLNIKEEM